MDQLTKALMTTVNRMVLEQSFINVVSAGLKQADGKSAFSKKWGKTANRIWGAFQNGLDSLKIWVKESMLDLLAWVLIIGCGISGFFYLLGIIKAAVIKRPDRLKELAKVVFSIFRLLWIFVEFLLVLFHLIPRDQPAANAIMELLPQIKDRLAQSDVENPQLPKRKNIWRRKCKRSSFRMSRLRSSIRNSRKSSTHSMRLKAIEDGSNSDD